LTNMKKVFPILFLFLLSVDTYSQIGGSSAFAFTEIPYAASQAAFGGAGLTMNNPRDVGITMLNPSLLNANLDNHASLSYTNYLADINFGYAGYAKHFDSVGTFSGHISFIEYGEFDRRDETGALTGKFRATDYIFQIGYANVHPDYPKIKYGANVKFLYSVYEAFVATAGAVDAALTYDNKENQFLASAMIRNLGYNFIPYDEVRHPLPLDVQIGFSKKLAHNPLKFSLVAHSLQRWDLGYANPNLRNKEIDLETGEVKNAEVTAGDNLLRHINAGMALVFSDNFELRGGLNFQRRREMGLENNPGAAGFSWGFGIGIKKFYIDYAMVSYFRGISVSHFNLTKNLSDFKRVKA
jgi:hypothetical protein